MTAQNLRVGITGAITPPMDTLIKNAQRNEAQGYDSIWWPDHLMGWTPQSIWTPDIGEIAGRQKSSDIFFDCIGAIAAAAMATQSMRLGTSVTEPVRRHPAMLAQSFLTLDHIAKGRVILGIGAGEAENIIPYGLGFSKPAGRLEEAIEIIRLLWESDGPVDYEGKFWHLDRAVLGLEPYEGKLPPIWVAAHGPRMLDIAGRLGDGWLPTRMSVEEYGEKLSTIKRVGEAHGRDMSQFTPSMYTYLVIDEDHEVCHKLLDTPIIKSYCMIPPPEVFAKCGAKHPLGNTYGLLDYIPSHFNRDAALEAIGRIPPAVCEYFIVHGTPDDVVRELKEFAKVGLQHVVLENITFLGDLSKVKSSYTCMTEVVRQVSPA